MKQNNDYLISFADFKNILLKHYKKILLFSTAFALFGAIWTLSKTPEYIFEATFKEKGKTQAGISKSFADAIFSVSGGATESEAVSFMKSRKITQKLVKELNLQGQVHKIEEKWDNINDIYNNLLVEWALFDKKRHPVIPDARPDLQLVDIDYHEEIPMHLSLKFETDDAFNVKNNRNELLGRGHLGDPFVTNNIKFTIVKNHDFNPKDSFLIDLQPLTFVADNIAKNLMVSTDKNDRTLLILRYPHKHRLQGAKILNQLMNLYREHLKEENYRISQEQLDYLETRQTEMGIDLKKMMDDHATKLSSDLVATGFPNSAKAMDFLGNIQMDFRQKLMSIDLETKRLQKAQEESYIYYDRYSSHGDPQIINDILSEIRNLKQQGDALDLALRSKVENISKESEDLYIQQMNELVSIQQYKKDVQTLIANLEQNKPLDLESKILNDPRFLIKTWHTKIQTDNSAQVHQNFKLYLKNLHHLFQFYEKTLQERLTHQQNSQNEFNGIDLATSRELYINYTRQLNDVQSQILQFDFVSHQMQEPEFEISSLSTVLADHVSQEMINKATNILLNLRDENNRSIKEQERLKEELALQEGFLAIHLKQSKQLLELRESLFKNKIKVLQNVTLGLIHQQVSILEKNLKEYIVTRLTNLKQERNLIHDHQLQLQKDMAALPKKWVTEKLIDQKLAMNQLMVEELTRMVESKNIASNLELVLSAPLDSAISPIHPKPPRLALYLLLGAFMGCCLSVTFFFVRAVLKGIPVSPENLKIQHQHVSGKVSKTAEFPPLSLCLESDLESLRKISNFFCDGNKTKQSLLLLKGNGYDYSQNLAHLISKKGYKVLLVPLVFDKPALPEELPGLIQFFEGQCPQPKITHSDDFDKVAPGGISRFANEYICSPKFNQFIETLKKEYDWIIATSPASATSAQGEGLIQNFDNIIINLTDETLPEIESAIQWKKNKSFVFCIA